MGTLIKASNWVLDTQLTDFTAAAADGANSTPHPDFIGTLRGVTGNRIVSNPQDTDEALYVFSAADTADFEADLAFGRYGTGAIDNTIGFCYRVQLTSKSFYRVRHNGTDWLLEKVVAGVATTLGTVTGPDPPNGAGVGLVGATIRVIVHVQGSVHYVYITDETGSTGRTTITATDSAFATGKFGVWGSCAGAVTGTAPSITPTNGQFIGYNTSGTLALLVGTNTVVTGPSVFSVVAAASSSAAPDTVVLSVTLPMLTVDASDTITPDNNGASTLPLLTLFAEATFENYILQTLPLPQVAGEIRTGSVLAEQLPLLVSNIVVLNGSYSTVDETLPAVTMAAATGSSVIETLPLVVLNASAVVGSSSVVNETLPALSLDGSVTSAPVYGISASLPPLVSSAQILPGGVGTLNESLPMLQLGAAALAGNVATLLQALPLLQVAATAQGASTNAGDSTLPALQMLAEAVQVVSEALELSLGQPAAWVVNLRNAALTSFDFRFNSMTLFNGKYLGASEAGIVEIGVQSNLDGTTPIVAYGRTGADDFESSFLKRSPYIYLQVQTDGEMYVSKISKEDGRRDFLLRWNQNSSLQQRRVATGRRSKSSHWQYEFGNRNGSGFRLVGADVLGQRTSRRMQ